MALVDSLLTAMVRANGDALVMHVGEKPIVVAGPRTMDLSSHGLNLTAMIGMLGQLLPADAQAQLTEFGAVEHALPSHDGNRFTVVAARSGDDIWIEIRRRREKTVVVAEPEPVVPVAEAASLVEQRVAEAARLEEPVAFVEPLVEMAPEPTPVSIPQPVAEIAPEPVAEAPPEAIAEPAPVVDALPETVAAAATAPVVERAPELVAEIASEPVTEGASAPVAEMSPEPVVEVALEPLADAASELVAEAAPQLAAVASLDAEAAPVAEVTSELPVTDSAEPALAEAEPVMLEAPEVAAVVEQVAEDVPVETVAAAHAEPPALIAVAAVESEAAVAAAGVAAAALHVPEPVAVMAGGGAPPLHTRVSSTAMSSMDTAPHSDSVGGGALPPVSPTAPTMAQTPTEDAPGPVTRTVRIEVPTRAVKASTAERLLRLAGTHGASELFLLSQTRPSVRVDGDIRVLSEESPMRAADLEALVAEVTPEPWADAVRRGDPAEWLIEIAEVGRVRCASFRDHRGPGAIFRFTSSQAASADQLALDDAARRLATEPDGLVVVAGPAGSDKAAIVGAFVDTINRQRGDYVITLEPQVRVAHDNRHALISQREVGTDAARALAAARGALRENPDVLVIEDLHSGDLAGLALAAANDSRLVIVSIEAGSTAEAVQKVLELVAEDGRAQARSQLARAFRGAISQLLVRKLSGGRVAAREMLSGSQATARVLADAPLDGLAAALDASREAANVPLVASLVGYVKAGVVDVREAYRKAPDQPKVLAALKAAGVDTAPIEGLA